MGQRKRVKGSREKCDLSAACYRKLTNRHPVGGNKPADIGECRRPVEGGQRSALILMQKEEHLLKAQHKNLIFLFQA